MSARRQHICHPSPHRVRVATTGGTVLEADEAVLALGVFQPDLRPAEAAVAGHPRFAENPWNVAALDRLSDSSNILIIGASLSMVDAIASMEARGFRGRYRVISRRGQFVEGRRNAEPARDFLAEGPLPSTARDLLARVKTERRQLAAAGGDWQGLPLAIRPHILPLWQNANDRERLRFARHLRAFWDVTAHRSAPESHRSVEEARSQGRLIHGTARLLALRPDENGIAATLKTAAGLEETVFGGVIDCRGHQLHDWRQIADPFVRQLLSSGEVRPHSTGFASMPLPKATSSMRRGAFIAT